MMAGLTFAENQPGLEVIENRMLISLSMKIIILINVKMPIRVGTFTFINKIHVTTISESFKA